MNQTAYFMCCPNGSRKKCYPLSNLIDKVFGCSWDTFRNTTVSTEKFLRFKNRTLRMYFSEDSEQTALNRLSFHFRLDVECRRIFRVSAPSNDNKQNRWKLVVRMSLIISINKHKITVIFCVYTDNGCWSFFNRSILFIIRKYLF